MTTLSIYVNVMENIPAAWIYVIFCYTAARGKIAGLGRNGKNRHHRDLRGIEMKLSPRKHSGWVLAMKGSGGRMLGKFCWTDARLGEFPIKIFYTRREAREAKKTCCYRDALPVKVNIVIEAA